MQTNETVTGAPDLPTGWRFKVGIALFALMILLWILIPIEAALGMSAGTIAGTTAGIAIANKIILLLAIAVMGKQGFQELKGRAFKHLTPATTVSPTRYKIGLVMFFIPFLQGLLETWASHIAPQLVANSTVGGHRYGCHADFELVRARRKLLGQAARPILCGRPRSFSQRPQHDHCRFACQMIASLVACFLMTAFATTDLPVQR